ncbi:MAG: glutaredoxin [Candidatus Pacebacteria bacterium]|nr:glutaredoxin [Candidatus Paceibacterota bacterium]
MQRLFIQGIFAVFLALTIVSPAAAHPHAQQPAEAQAGVTGTDVTIFFFGRDDCTYCALQKEFMDEYVAADAAIAYEYLNVITDEHAKAQFAAIIEKHSLSHVTPLTVIGETIIQGFNAAETTGERIKAAVEVARTSDIKTLNDHIERGKTQSDVIAEAGCDKDGAECGVVGSVPVAGQSYLFKLPMLGVVDLQEFSLFALSGVLGVIDGFNPCAMWVLVTFLVLLSQAGSRKKMIYVAGLFILAEAIMYNLILNIWFTAWDFVGLDQIVTPLVGLLALGGGAFFLHRWHKNRGKALTCDISDLEEQSKTTEKIKDLIQRPFTFFTALGIIGIAFSVNVIEFACSIGIPQAYTKILELNALTFLEQQFYIMVYTVGYMVDDIIVFGLAIWGFSKLEAHGHKYSQASLLIGGFLMLVLGAILVFNPDLLVL